ncbi:MAG: NapC/NirT family cytochrome c [Bacteroidales bacterium]|nr:NapC/NirT family cytochrome c [Bacteroidales bacterium]
MKLPNSVYNWTTAIGAVIASVSLFLILFFIGISFFFQGQGAYLGLLTYMVFPAFLILGLILIPIGMWRRHRKLLRGDAQPERRWPKIDFNESRNRNALFIFSASTVIFLLLSAVGSYQAFHFTETVEFCGKMCHRVMEPEYVAYQNSPHARVTCVECHVGTGATWYVKSKMSGLYQVYATALDIYPRPIPTPIENLRPARETCEICHWPEKHYAHKMRLEKRFLADENNTEWDIALNMKIGAAYSPKGLEEGIHWHINPDISVEYITTDEKRQTIPWVRLTNHKTGEVVEYMDEMNPAEADVLAASHNRVMDCMDCHNRPSHDYKSPANFMDFALTSGAVPVELPMIKKVSMDLLHMMYESRDSAVLSIESAVWAYYRENYPVIAADSPALIEKAIAGITDQFSKNIFPAMNVRWDAYPNHLGHLEFNGCYRCHDGNHKSSEGRVISRECNLCHNITAQGRPGNMQTTDMFGFLEFNHPVDIGDAWKEFNCVECHAYLY